MKLRLPLITAAIGLTCFSVAQNGPLQRRSCGSEVPPPEWDTWFNQKVTEHLQNASVAKGLAANYVIPVVVHVIHGGQNVGIFPNISNAQINSQIAVLNQDFAGTGYNVSQTPSPFAPYIANCNVTFSLAQLDPSGNSLPQA